jgi:hypothetical protein
MALSQPRLPHRNDETAATIIPPQPPTEAEDEVTDGRINFHASTNSAVDVDLEAAREDTIARLMDRIELLERRVDAQETVGHLSPLFSLELLVGNKLVS